MKREDLIYAACVIDCEGSIGIGDQRTPYKGRNPEHFGKIYLNYRLFVSTSMVDSVIVPWLARTFKLGSSCHSPHPHGGQDINRWTLSTADGEKFLRMILPYLKLKYPQAKIALRFCWLKHHANRTRNRGVRANEPIRDSIQRQFAHCKRQLMRLHTRSRV